MRAIQNADFGLPVRVGIIHHLDSEFGLINWQFILQALRRFDARIQPQLILLQKTMFNIEGLGRQLYPDLDIWKTASPILREWMREKNHPANVARRLWKQMPELLDALAQRFDADSLPLRGGGLVLAAISDLVLSTPDAKFGSPIAFTLGNTLSVSSLARLSATFGRRLAMEMLLTGRLLTAQEAFDAGFVTRITDPEGMTDALQDVLDRIRQAAPATLASFKEFERRLDSSVFEIPVDDVYEQVYGSADFREGVSAFLQRRPPRFTGA